jgi:hypothetical protein
MRNDEILANFIRQKHALGASRQEIIDGVAEHGGDAALVDRVLADQQAASARAKEDEEVALRYLTARQSLMGAMIAGGITAVLSAGIWAGIAYATNYQIAWVAVILGCAVAWSVRRFGRGLDSRFRLIGLLAAVAGVFFGNTATVILVVSRDLALPTADMIWLMGDPQFHAAIIEDSTLLDLVFYLAAAVCGWQGSAIGISEQSAADVARREETGPRA